MPEQPNTQHPIADRRWLLILTLSTMLFTVLPYLLGWLGAQERSFMWLGYNLDDSCVYLSWMRQAAEGSLHALNLFTTDTQKGMLLNPFFLVLGWIARLTHLPLLAVYHLARLGCGAGLILIIWKFIKAVVANSFARRMALLCVCFASGLGWLPVPWEAFPTAPTCPAGPIDFWQPEAITFLSLLLSPLFCFSLALQAGILLLLFKGEQTGRMRFGAAAGACGFLLGLVHTYDILSVSAVWGVYLVVLAIQFFRRSTSAQSTHTISSGHLRHTFLQALVAGVCSAPAVAYIYHQLHTETTFLKRANVVTGAALPAWVVLGYGLTLALAMYSVFNMFRNKQKESPPASPSASEVSATDENTANAVPQYFPHTLFASRAALNLLMIWSTVNILVSYLPVSIFPFQRKMLQGAHFPIAILAGCGLASLLMQPATLRSFRNVNIAAAITLLALGLTNLRFITREITNYRDNHVQSGQRAYLNAGEMEALHWIETNTPADAAIQSLPWVVRTGEHSLGMADMTLALFIPGLTHHKVYCGHWGETPDYDTKRQKLVRFENPQIPEEDRITLLQEAGIKYLLFSQKRYQQILIFHSSHC